MVIRCPHCQFSRSITLDKIPATAEVATCPKCNQRFRFRTLPKKIIPELHQNPHYEQLADDEPHKEELEQHQHSAHKEPQPAAPAEVLAAPQDAPIKSKTKGSAPKKDIWDALSSLTKLWEKEKGSEADSASPLEQGEILNNEESSSQAEQAPLHGGAEGDDSSVSASETGEESYPSYLQKEGEESSIAYSPSPEEEYQTPAPAPAQYSPLLPKDDEDVEIHIHYVDGKPASFRNPWVKKNDPLPEDVSLGTEQDTNTYHDHSNNDAHDSDYGATQSGTASHAPHGHPANLRDSAPSGEVIPPAAPHESHATHQSNHQSNKRKRAEKAERPLTPLENLMAEDAQDQSASSQSAFSRAHPATITYDVHEVDTGNEPYATPPLHASSTAVTVSLSEESEEHGVTFFDENAHAHQTAPSDTEVDSNNIAQSTFQSQGLSDENPTPKMDTNALDSADALDNTDAQDSADDVLGNYLPPAFSSPASERKPEDEPHALRQNLTAEEENTSSAKQATESQRVDKQGEHPDAPASEAHGTAPVVRQLVDPKAKEFQEKNLQDMAQLVETNKPFDYKDTTPEERVEKDLCFLQTTAERPTKELGILRETQLESTLYPFSETREIPWEHPQTYGVFSSLLRTIKSVMFSAPAFFRTIPPLGGMAFAFLFFILHGYLAVMCTTFWVILAAVLFDLPSLGHVQDLVPTIALFTPVALSLLLIAATSFTRIFLILFQRQQATFAFTFKLLCYSIAPLLLSIIPFIGPIAGLIWSFVILGTACHHSTGLSPVRAIITIAPTCLLTLWLLFLLLP